MASADSDDMQDLYQWIDDIPLTRPKRSISRDFSDGVLAAELVCHFFPKLVDLHNYSAANSVSQKQYNWKTLNQKVFKKLGLTVSADDIKGVCECVPGVIERVLANMRRKIIAITENGGALPVQQKKKIEVPASAPCNKNKHAPAKQNRQVPVSQPVPKHRQHPVKQRQPAAVPATEPRPEQAVRPTYNIPLMQAGNQPRPLPQQQPRVNRMTELEKSGHQEPIAEALPDFSDLDTDILVEKETTIQELRETVGILETKIQKMEQLLQLKDQKISKLMSALEAR